MNLRKSKTENSNQVKSQKLILSGYKNPLTDLFVFFVFASHVNHHSKNPKHNKCIGGPKEPAESCNR